MTKAPTIELRGIKHHASLSEETEAYSATLVVDGTAIGTVSNHGTGGPDQFSPAKGHTMKTYWDINDRVKAALPPEKYTYGDRTYELQPDLESECHRLLSEHLIKRDINRLMRSKVLFVDEKNRLMHISFRGVRKLEPRHVDRARQSIAKSNPGARIFADMSEAERIEAYRGAAS